MHLARWCSNLLVAVSLLSLASARLSSRDGSFLRRGTTFLENEWSYAPLLSRGDRDNDDDNLDPYFLGGCVPICGDRCCDSRPLRKRSNSSEAGQVHTFKKRALEDLRGWSQEDLGRWIEGRIPADGSDVEMIFEFDENEDLNPAVELVCMDDRVRPYYIPTSKFMVPGNEPFAWGTVGLVGCTLLTMAKTPTAEDPTSGVYMAHYWEEPSFSGHFDFPVDDTTGEVLRGKPQVRVLEPQFDSFVTNFMQLGFPHELIDNRAEPGEDSPPDPPYQDSIEEHKNDLKRATAIIMHPKRMAHTREPDPDDPSDRGEWIWQNQAHYPGKVTSMKAKVRAIMRSLRGSSAVQWLNEYLYEPDRGGRSWIEGKSGRSIFQYDPNFGGRKTGMLLLEDGGVQTLQRDGSMRGPGGPFYFDFGPAEDVEMEDPQDKK